MCDIVTCGLAQDMLSDVSVYSCVILYYVDLLRLCCEVMFLSTYV